MAPCSAERDGSISRVAQSLPIANKRSARVLLSVSLLFMEPLLRSYMKNFQRSADTSQPNNFRLTESERNTKVASWLPLFPPLELSRVLWVHPGIATLRNGIASFPDGLKRAVDGNLKLKNYLKCIRTLTLSHN